MRGRAADPSRMARTCGGTSSNRPSRPAGRRDGLRAAGVALALALAGGLAWPGRAAADSCPRPEVWLASSRRLPCVRRLPDRAGLDVERLSCGDHGRWERAPIADLLAEDTRPLVVFVHGNRYTAHEARHQGVRVARTLARACPDAGPLQTLVFSWPSERQGLLLRDVRAKYDRAPADGHYLAWLLRRVAPTRPVAIVGHSYGALVSLEALRDLVAVGRPGGAAWADRPGRTHVVLVAPAVRCDALAPRGPYRQSLACVDRLTLVANSSDVALHFFDCVDRRTPTAALGAVAMPRRWLPADVEYRAVDAADIVGACHRLCPYLDSAVLARRIATAAVADLEAAW